MLIVRLTALLSAALILLVLFVHGNKKHSYLGTLAPPRAQTKPKAKAPQFISTTLTNPWRKVAIGQRAYVGDSLVEPVGVAESTDGGVWVTEEGDHKGADLFGMPTQDGKLIYFDRVGHSTVVATHLKQPDQIVVDRSGTAWFIEHNGADDANGTVDSASQSGHLRRFGHFIDLVSLIIGPDGNIWCTDAGSGDVDKLTPAGILSRFHVGDKPFGITVGSDGNIWYTKQKTVAADSESDDGSQGPPIRTGSIESMSTSGDRSAEYALSVSPGWIAKSEAGDLWFTVAAATGEQNSGEVGRISSQGALTLFGGSLPFPIDIVPAPDGAMWFLAERSGSIGRINNAGVITWYPASLPGDTVSETYPVTNLGSGSIASLLPAFGRLSRGRSGNLWFSVRAAEHVSRITSGLLLR